MKILIDMNLSPDWVQAFSGHSRQSIHWSSIGSQSAKDQESMSWARANGQVVFTHDLDFGTMLAMTRAIGPSVIQVRGQNVLPDHMAHVVIAAPDQHEAELLAGALIVVDEVRLRVRLLPI